MANQVVSFTILLALLIALMITVPITVRDAIQRRIDGLRAPLLREAAARICLEVQRAVLTLEGSEAGNVTFPITPTLILGQPYSGTGSCSGGVLTVTVRDTSGRTESARVQIPGDFVWVESSFVSDRGARVVIRKYENGTVFAGFNI